MIKTTKTRIGEKEKMHRVSGERNSSDSGRDEQEKRHPVSDEEKETQDDQVIVHNTEISVGCEDCV